MDDDYEAAEGVHDQVGGLHVGGHVPVVALRAGEAPVERVETDDGGRHRIGHLRANCSDEFSGVRDEGEARGHQVERDRPVIGLKVVQLERDLAGFEALLSPQCAVDDGTGLDAVSLVVSADGDVHRHVEG